MKKFLRTMYNLELKMCEALGTRFTYLLLALSVIGCYLLGYEIGKIVF